MIINNYKNLFTFSNMKHWSKKWKKFLWVRLVSIPTSIMIIIFWNYWKKILITSKLLKLSVIKQMWWRLIFFSQVNKTNKKLLFTVVKQSLAIFLTETKFVSVRSMGFCKNCKKSNGFARLYHFPGRPFPNNFSRIVLLCVVTLCNHIYRRIHLNYKTKN